MLKIKYNFFLKNLRKSLFDYQIYEKHHLFFSFLEQSI